MSRTLHGSLSYLGVRAINPPEIYTHPKDPLPSDYRKFEVTDLWLTKRTTSLFMLTNKLAGVATWTRLNTTGSASFTDITITTINYTSTLRTLADGIVYGLPDPCVPGNVYLTNNSNTAQWGSITSTGGTVSVTATIDGINLEAAGGSAAGIFTADDGNAITPTGGGNIFILGDGGNYTTATTANTIKVENRVTINTQVGVAYTLQLTDSSKEVQFTNAAAVTVSIPTAAAVAFETGTVIYLVQYGAGTVTVTPDAGVTLNSAGAMYDTYEQYSGVAIILQSADCWLLVGDSK